MENSKAQTSTSDIAFVLFKHKWSALVVLAAGLIGSLVWLFCIHEDLYAANAKVLVKLGAEQAPPATVMGAAPQVIGYRYQEVNSEVEILQNTALIARLVDELGLDKEPPEPPPPTGMVPLIRYRVKHVINGVRTWMDDTMVRIGLREKTPPRDRAINSIQGGLKVKAEKESNVFSAEMSLPQKHAAAFVLNRLLDMYMELRPKLYQNKGVDFFAAGVKRNSSELAKTEDDIRKFESQGDISLLQEQQAQLVHQIVQSQAAVKEAELAVKDASYRVSQLDTELAKPEPNLGTLGDFDRDSIPNGILRQITSLQQDREAMRMTQLDTGEKIQNNRQQFKALVGMLAANLRSTLVMKKDDLAAHEQTLQGLQTQLSTLHDKQSDWVAMHRDSSAKEESLQFYRRKLEEATAADALERLRIGNVIVIQPAVDMLQPVGMRKTYLFGMAALASLLAAIVWISLLELFDQRIYKLEQLEAQIDVPVLAAVPSGRLPRMSPVAVRESHAREA
jgi:uncharacterized protein involved in exopolysaccharide biosynthesis